MTPFEYMKSRTEAEVRAICSVAKTKFSYFEQIAYGHRRPSFELAERLADASGGAMSVIELLNAKRDRENRIAESAA